MSRRLTVSPISKHPGLLTTLERLLIQGNFKVLPIRLNSNHVAELDRAHKRAAERTHLPRASVFVLDGNSLNMPAEALIERMREEYPRARLLVVKETLRDEKIFPFLRLGARGVVRYADAESDLAKAVTAVVKGDFWLSREQLVRFVDWILSTSTYRRKLNEPGPLSRREREVLPSILGGLTNKEIASALNISERTVKFHVSHLLHKLGAHRRADLIANHYRQWPITS